MAKRNQWLKKYFLSQYLFIAILSVKMSRVNKALNAKILGQKWNYVIMLKFLSDNRIQVQTGEDSISDGETSIPMVTSHLPNYFHSNY